MQKGWKLFSLSLCLAAVFLLWTIALCTVDVQSIGPQETSVGLAAVNAAAHKYLGTNMDLYLFTDLLSVIPFGFAAGFALLGLKQWIMRKSLRRVDGSLLLLGCFYIAVAAVYLFFERNIINYRPVLIEGRLEASYPSSTTMLVLCIMPTAAMQLCERIQSRALKAICIGSSCAYTFFMVVGRVFSGVHWISDIVGAILLSAALVTMYAAVVRIAKK